MDILCFIWKLYGEQIVNWGCLFSSETRHILQCCAFFPQAFSVLVREAEREKERKKEERERENTE